ncbi:putative glycoside hydrolase [Reinekea marinisedimentorum]|uniref:Putative glycosyl hydrolase-like family 15 (GHL15) protein n=1 Tax=Reinekea marinisedimentorum TaxID=230495 RepID=A0A4R3I0S2_9GAMM|nr:putative glycoside hydrolase [Reinekea marinisedimentorum]TCS38784.1 putative glycosyl hydrolase-like family 15 (GHL15) protein [Reinekea marinisedimentorum]
MNSIPSAVPTHKRHLLGLAIAAAASLLLYSCNSETSAESVISTSDDADVSESEATYEDFIELTLEESDEEDTAKALTSDDEATSTSDDDFEVYTAAVSSLSFSVGPGSEVSLVTNLAEYDATTEYLLVSEQSEGNAHTYSVVWQGDDLDGDGSNDTVSFDLIVKGFSDSVYSYSETEGESSMTAYGDEADVVENDGYWSIADNDFIDEGETITFTIENVYTSAYDTELAFTGIASATLYEPSAGNNHAFVVGEGTDLDSFSFSAGSSEQSFDDTEQLILTGAGSGTWRNAAVADVTVEFEIVEDDTWMSYLSEFMDERIGGFSWDTPQSLVYIRKTGTWTEDEIDLVANFSSLLGVDDKTEFSEKYPDKLYGVGYMNLEKDYGSGDLDSGHYLTNPEHYLYNEDGSVVTGNGYPYFNLAVPEMREYWLSEVERQIEENKELGFDEPGYSFFIDGLLKAYDVGNSLYVDYWGEPVSDTYREEALKPLLAQMRDMYADQVTLVGNFLRPNRPNGMMDYVHSYIHGSYMELFERFTTGYVENANLGIQYMQEAAAAGKMLQLSLTKTKPTPVTELTLDEMREKASAAMPEFWAQLETDEQDELAEMYAYFDFKLALFLMGAGEYSYLKFIDTPLANSAGTDFFKNITPFPEWDMALGEPLEYAQQEGNVWTRRFEYVDIILDLDNGTATYLDPGSLDAMEASAE